MEGMPDFPLENTYQELLEQGQQELVQLFRSCYTSNSTETEKILEEFIHSHEDAYLQNLASVHIAKIRINSLINMLDQTDIRDECDEVAKILKDCCQFFSGNSKYSRITEYCYSLLGRASLILMEKSLVRKTKSKTKIS